MAQLPIFFVEASAADEFINLPEETAKHVVQVLRMEKGDKFHLTDGLGTLMDVTIIDAHKKHLQVRVDARKLTEKPATPKVIAISLLKNNSRFEWLLEKAAEMGISEIQPLICERTEKQHFRKDRLQSILTSAMLQSRQSWRTTLHEPVTAVTYIESLKEFKGQRFIAYCGEEVPKRFLPDALNASVGAHIVLIGPEGDFTIDEVQFAMQHHFIPVSLGTNRLRTETAGMVAAAWMMAETSD
jgi:16S rRNA (uracil1498-N3)-methyltransferase